MCGYLPNVRILRGKVAAEYREIVESVFTRYTADDTSLFGIFGIFGIFGVFGIFTHLKFRVPIKQHLDVRLSVYLLGCSSYNL